MEEQVIKTEETPFQKAEVEVPFSVSTPPPPGSTSNSSAKSSYSYSIPENYTPTKEQKDIMNNGKTVEELTIEELRVVYLLVGPALGHRLYSASAVNDIDRKGVHPEASKRDETDSLFIGTQVHLAMETQGASIGNLKTWGSLGPDPSKPDVSISPDHWKILEAMESGGVDHKVGYFMVKDTVAVKAVKKKEFEAYLTKPEELNDDAKKACEKIVKAADKEYEKFKKVESEVKQYYRKLRLRDEAKDKIRGKSEDVIIIDDLPYRKMNPGYIYEKIKKSYEALAGNQVVMQMYNNLYAQKSDNVESYIELPVLWEYEYSSGKAVPCKSMFDRVHVDKANKTMCIIDIKTHSKRATEFSETNYIEYKYFRSMAFYERAGRELLKQWFKEDVSDWTVWCVLMPVSTQSYEVGSYTPYCFVSPEDLRMGTEGSFCSKNLGSKFNEHGHLQYALGKDKFDEWKKLGLVHDKAYDFYVKGWKEIIKEYEETSLPIK